MDAIVIAIDTNAEAIIRELQRFPAKMQEQIARALDLQNELTIGDIQARKLSQRGPTTLGVVSNRLRRSIRKSKAVVSGDAVDSTIGSNVRYAGVHEFGFSGTVQVPAHTRHQVSNDIVGGRRRGFVQRQAREKVSASGFARVKAHSRKMQMPARAYIRTTIAERAPHYTKAISAAIVTAWQSGGAS